MNNKTRYKLESDKKANKNVRDKVYDFAMRTLNEKGYANFIFDDSIEDETVILTIDEVTEIIKLKK